MKRRTMARIVNEAAYAARRNAILDAAQRAIATKGYEQMAIADILGELGISSGAFYHYFDSKPALLLALVERIGDQIEQLVSPVVHDPTLPALDKLQRFYATVDLLLAEERSPEDLARLERIIAATADALERVLGAPTGCLQLSSHAALAQWLASSSGKEEEEQVC